MLRGGYRKPDKPAAVSGPGKFSKRTDGQPTAAPVIDTPGQRFGAPQMLDRRILEKVRDLGLSVITVPHSD
jgi:hypothetical protein